jgi:hypothetical protein
MYAWRGWLGPTGTVLVKAPRARRAFKRRLASIAEETFRDPRSRIDSPRRRAAGSCSVRVIYSCLPNPLFGPPARERERTPARVAGLGRGHRAGGVTPVEQATSPAVKTSSPRLPPRDAERAVGGIRAWGENPGRRASSPTTVLPFRVLAHPNLAKSARTLPRDHRRTRCPPPPAATDHARIAPMRAAKQGLRAVGARWSRALASRRASRSTGRWRRRAAFPHMHARRCVSAVGRPPADAGVDKHSRRTGCQPMPHCARACRL